MATDQKWSESGGSLAAFPSSRRRDVAPCSSAGLMEKEQVTARLSVADFMCIYMFACKGSVASLMQHQMSVSQAALTPSPS